MPKPMSEMSPAELLTAISLARKSLDDSLDTAPLVGNSAGHLKEALDKLLDAYLAYIDEYKSR